MNIHGKTLTEIVRACVATLDKSDEGSAAAALEPIRAALKARGLGPNCHVGKKGMSPKEVLEWYAGQGLDIIDSKSWFAVNSWINSVDRFAPEGGS